MATGYEWMQYLRKFYFDGYNIRIKEQDIDITIEVLSIDDETLVYRVKSYYSGNTDIKDPVVYTLKKTKKDYIDLLISKIWEGKIDTADTRYNFNFDGTFTCYNLNNDKWEEAYNGDRKSTRLNSSHIQNARMLSSA